MLSTAITSALIIYAVAGVISVLVVGIIKLVTFLIRRMASRGPAN